MKSEPCKTCKLCGENRKLANAHIIPESFFRETRDSETTLIMLPSRQGARTQRRPIGEYDQNILCKECECKFSPLDTFGADVLINNFDKYFSPGEGRYYQSQSSSIDKIGLLKFLISIIWRASVSRREFFSKIKLDEHYESLCKQFFLQDSFSSVFDAVLARWTTNPPNLSPQLHNCISARTYILYMGRTIAYIKVDENDFPSDLDDFALGKRGGVKIIEREFYGSNEESTVMNVIKGSNWSGKNK